MNEAIVQLILWAIVITVHEGGHYLGFLMYKIPARLEVRWWGFQFNYETVFETSVNQMFVINSLGILLGLIAVFFFDLNSFIYLLMCSVDFISFLLYMFIKPKYWNEKIELESKYDLILEKIK